MRRVPRRTWVSQVEQYGANMGSIMRQRLDGPDPIRHDWRVLTQSNSRSGASHQIDLASLIPGWSDRGQGSLARRLAHAIRNGIESGLMGDGVRLPPERTLAASLAISRSTVATALDELRADGLVVSRQGSGTIVLGRGSRVIAGSRIAEHFGGWTGIDLAVGNPPDASHLPSVSIDVADLVATGEGTGDAAARAPWHCGRRLRTG